jgi:hypothetical protein
MEIDYVGVLIQWLIFFGFLSIFLFPALMFRNIANRNGAKGWLYFIFGMGVGMLALQAGRLMIYILGSFIELHEGQPYLLIVMFITAYIIVGVGVIMLKKGLPNQHN